MKLNSDLSNSSAYNFFKQICKIPHGSGNEQGLADYIENFARERGLYCYRDAYNSVLIRKPANKRHGESVLLQGHLDMVCEKNAGVDFDFLKDGIIPVERGGFLYASGTTLGADDGVAVALMLSLLDDKSFEAPEIECLFTTGEETSLVGAMNFDYSRIKSRKMINLDTEKEGEAVAGSAGGVRCKITCKPEFVQAASGEKTYTIKIGGLKGGHSGCDINAGRLSACVLGAKLLRLLGDKVGICAFTGGNMDNAIARECEITVNTCDEKHVFDIARDFETTMKAKACKEDAGLYIKVEGTDNISNSYTPQFSSAFVNLINEIPHGVSAMSRDMEGLVESSSNFASVKRAGEDVIISVSMRSSVEQSLAAMKDSVRAKAESSGFETKFDGEYPGWQYDPDSQITQAFRICYKKLTGADGRVEAIHAGLECGVVKSRIPDMDIVSIGPNIYDIHTPNERLDIGSFLRFTELVRMMIDL